MDETNKFELDRDGVMILPGVLSRGEAKSWTEKLDAVFSQQLTAIKNRGGAVYAARNILDAIPDEFSIAKRPAVGFMLEHVLGSQYGLVRGLYFDKHPERTWSLPWHKDMTIAVKDNTLPSRPVYQTDPQIGRASRGGSRIGTAEHAHHPGPPR